MQRSVNIMVCVGYDTHDLSSRAIPWEEDAKDVLFGPYLLHSHLFIYFFAFSTHFRYSVIRGERTKEWRASRLTKPPTSPSFEMNYCKGKSREAN